MLQTGSTAPPFSLHDHEDRVRTLDEFLEQGPLVLYFYPADFTPVCTAEACTFRDIHARIAAAGVQLVGVSPQSASSHAKFRAKHELPFPLLADPKKQTIRAYDALGLFGLMTQRITYLINTDATIADAVRSDLSAKAHAKFVDRAINAQTSTT